ncbi:VOC family protein [Halobellus limi]|jgi:YD repeat-containing protein|uniref:VOC family protein n=1 Tax=Halobellus limi TaxID=699433 RepID=A0A1H5SVF7_9EURY|nr:VOC family protein [Halobellus limi]QCC47479.1 VOC family protein [Halobellus limi]SEF54546.1 YD repeat-containing protein [Halobellus limi]
MVESRYTHVSIVAADLEESVDFYASVFGMERIRTPAFDERIQWLGCGDLQLHLVERDDDPPAFNHHALHVDDFEAVYRSIREHESAEIEALPQIEVDADGHPPVYVLPSGEVQCYVRDPAGNLVEVNAPDADALDGSVVRNLVKRTDVEWPEAGEEAARIYANE